MDKDLRHGKTYMKDAQVTPPSPEQVPLNPWDFPESDTESLVQEKAYQQELQMRIGSNKTICIQTQEEKTSSLLQTEEHEPNKAEEEALQVYDSLDLAALEFEKNDPLLSSIEASNAPLDTHERDLSRQSSDDAYSELRYDPNWRTNLKEAGLFNESPHLTFEEDTKDDRITPEQRWNENEVLSMKGGCQYVVIRGPALAEAPHGTTADECEQPYHLHQQHSEASTVVSVTSPPQRCTVDERSERKLRNEETLNRVSTTLNGFPEHADEEKIPARYDDEQEILSYSQRDRSHQVATKNQSLSKWKNPELLRNRKLETPREDVVERNKITLGRDTDKCGSYLKAYAMKQETHNTLDQVSDIPEEVILTPTEGLEWSPEDCSDPELRWLQKTQQLKVIQFTKRKKDKQKGSPKPSSQNRPPALAAGARPGGHVSPRAAETQPSAQTFSLPQPVILLSDAHTQLSRRQRLTSMPSESQPEPTLLARASPVERQPALPTINLSINLSTSSQLLPFLHQSGRDAVITLASPHGLHWTPAADGGHVNSPFTRDTRVPMLSPHVGQGQGDMVPQRGLSSPTSDPGCRRQGLNGDLLHWPQENRHGRCQRLTAPQWPPSHMENNRNCSPSGVCASPFLDDIVRLSSQSQHSGSYTVLPPIGKPLSGGEPELSAGHCGQREETRRKNPIPRSCSDGYLAQMEKQRQLEEKATYKPYTLKDYKYLKQDINLCGLGPDLAAIEKTKMRRQKLYSNVIREQNKKISRIPFLPAKELEGSDKNVPRRKALEYARNIAKPPIRPQPNPKPKQQPPSKDSTQNAPYLEGLDLSQLTTLELLRKRHEEEKLAVARFRKVH